MAIKIIKKAVPASPKLDGVIELRSFTKEGVWYLVDRNNGTCTCPQYAAEGYCKHLEQVGVYKKKSWSQRTHPTFSQALSGLVKAIRIRNVEEAIYWLVYLDTFTHREKGARFRVARRLLIGAAEDGVSIPVMEKVSSNYGHLCQLDTHMISLAAEVVRICKLPNWWHPDSGGPDYIHAAMVAQRKVAYGIDKGLQLHEKLKIVEDAVANRDRDTTSLMLEYLVDTPGLSRGAICDFLLTLAERDGNEQAKRVLTVHYRNKPSLNGDYNFLGQGLWLLAGGEFPTAEGIEVVYSKEVRNLILEAQHKWNTAPHRIPEWCCDGIHCSGTDRRFAGMTVDMDAVGNAFKFYGRIDPSDAWRPEFYSLDGLEIK